MADKFIGMDLGTSTVKAVEINSKKDALIMTKAYLLPMHPDSLVDGTIIDYAEVTEQVRKVVASGGFTNKKIAIPLKGSNSIARFVRIPMINANLLKKDMLYFADQYMNIEPEEFSIDFNILRTNLTENTADVLLAATRKDVLSDYVSVLESADLEIGAVDIESIALCNLYTAMKYPESETSMILHIGHTGTLAVIMRDGHFVYHENSPTGGSYCNDLLINLAHVPEDSVDIAKMTPDISSYGESVKKVLAQNFIPDLLRDVEKIINNYQVLGGTDPVRVYLSGGGATLTGLQEALSETLKAHVGVMDPRQMLTVESSIAIQVLEKSPAILNIAVAMALR